MRILRRFVVLLALMFWQGGFLFYVSVVVPLGTQVLGSALRQGFITRKVTYWLNISGVIALGILALELWLCRDRSRGRNLGRWLMWGLMAAAQGLLFPLHGYLDSLMQEQGRIVLDPEAFYPAHRVYLWTHTVQWGCGLVLLVLLVWGWQREDRGG